MAKSIRTNIERPSSLSPRSSRSARQPQLAGTLPLDAPAHLAAGSVEIDDDIDCDCSWGCPACDPTVQR